MPVIGNRALAYRGAMLALGLACAAFSQPRHTLPASLAAPDAAIDTILTGLNGSGGIAADDKGNVTVSEPPASRSWRLPAGGAKRALASAAGLTVRGLVYDAQGRLFFCQDDKLGYFDADGAVHDLATRPAGGGKLGHNNDLVILDDGSVYFTNGDGNTIYYWHPGADPIVAAAGLNYPDGIEADEKAGKVYVTLFNQPYALAAFAIQPDHTLAGKQVLATLGIPDGLTLDALGNFYVTSLAEGCVAVFSPAGGELGRITFPGEKIHNVAFGGRRNDTLYITGEYAAFKMPMKVAGQRDPFRAAAALGPAPFRPRGRYSGDRPLPALIFAAEPGSPLRDARGRLLPPSL
jgi:gluconolactonase